MVYGPTWFYFNWFRKYLVSEINIDLLGRWGGARENFVDDSMHVFVFALLHLLLLNFSSMCWHATVFNFKASAEAQMIKEHRQ